MGSIPEIITYLEFGREELLKSIEGLSHRELTQTPIFEDWTIKDVLAHIIGWDQYVLEILPLILQNNADKMTTIDVESMNRRSVAAWQDKAVDQVIDTVQSTHRQIVDIIAGLDHVEIDMRRDRGGRFITIRSYVIDVMVEHERQHAVEIEQWREALDSSINPNHTRKTLNHNRATVLAAIEGLSEVDVLDKSAADGWSAKDVLAHLAAWEGRMLNGARHLVDPSQPAPQPISSIVDWNDKLAVQHAERSWLDVWAYFTEIRQDLNGFLDQLEWDDWKQRGPCPWPHDQGTLAELITHIAEHDAEHIPSLQQWRSQKVNA